VALTKSKNILFCPVLAIYMSHKIKIEKPIVTPSTTLCIASLAINGSMSVIEIRLKSLTHFSKEAAGQGNRSITSLKL